MVFNNKEYKSINDTLYYYLTSGSEKIILCGRKYGSSRGKTAKRMGKRKKNERELFMTFGHKKFAKTKENTKTLTVL